MKRLSRQRGVAIVTALLLTTLAVTIVASLFWQQQVQVRSIENQNLQLQKQWILRSALDWAGLILREDARHSRLDDLQEPWAMPLADTRLDEFVAGGETGGGVAEAVLSGRIMDAQGRYNLTNLCPGGQIDPLAVLRYGRLLEALNLPATLAMATADACAAAWVGTLSNGAGQGSAPQHQPGKLFFPEDVLSVPGHTPEIYARLRPYIIALPRITPLNINTAPAEVLLTLDGSLTREDADALVSARSQAAFRDLADLGNRLPGRLSGLTAMQAAVSSSFFLVQGQIRMRHGNLATEALLERRGNRTSVVWAREQ